MYRSAIGLILCVAAGTAAGEENGINPLLNESFSFRLGANFLSADGTIGASREGGQKNPGIDLDTLGMDDNYTSAYFGARWRPTDRWRLTFQYFNFDSDGDLSANFDDLGFGDIDVSGFVRVQSQLQTGIYVVQAGYSFLKNDRAELGAGLGLHVVDFDTKLAVSGRVGDFTGIPGTDNTDITAPLPNILAFGTYAFTPKLSLDASLGYFSLNYDKYDGSMAAAAINLEYRFTKHFGAGFGYNYVNMNLDVDDGDITYDYNLDYQGPVVFLSAGF